MGWFSIVSILLFLLLIIREHGRMRSRPEGRARGYFLIGIFSIHILVIVYLGFI